VSSPLVCPTQIVKGDLIVVDNLVYEVKGVMSIPNHGFNAPAVEMILVPPGDSLPEKRIAFYMGGVLKQTVWLYQSAAERK